MLLYIVEVLRFMAPLLLFSHLFDRQAVEVACPAGNVCQSKPVFELMISLIIVTTLAVCGVVAYFVKHGCGCGKGGGYRRR